MRRREFIAFVGSAAVAWPLTLRAQQSKPKAMRRVAMLMPYSANDPQVQERNAAFLQGLQQLGWTVGENVQIDYRWSAGREDDTRKYAAELVSLAPDVLLVSGSAGVEPLRRVTRTVPIVFVLVPDPVGAGFVDSLARPGGNVTGFTQYDYSIAGKWLALLKEIAPNTNPRCRFTRSRHHSRHWSMGHNSVRLVLRRHRGSPSRSDYCACSTVPVAGGPL
jgi:putative ABC transport system substrate-binding protein